MKLRIRKKQPVYFAVEIKGNRTPQGNYLFDNLGEIREMCEWYINWNNVFVDEASGLITIPNVGTLAIGQYLVEGETGLECIWPDTLQNQYDIVE